MTRINPAAYVINGTDEKKAFCSGRVKEMLLRYQIT